MPSGARCSSACGRRSCGCSATRWSAASGDVAARSRDERRVRVVVIGSGHNGLVAATHLAAAGVDVTVLERASRIGGATASSEATLPGFVHDHCAGFVPLAVASPALRELGLERDGLRWVNPPLVLAHPFADGAAGALHRDVDLTVESLGAAGAGWAGRYASHASTRADSDGSDPHAAAAGPPAAPARARVACRRVGSRCTSTGTCQAATAPRCAASTPPAPRHIRAAPSMASAAAAPRALLRDRRMMR
jgi:glycine/D-amino acid oxidase-like deaminating enzyme